MSQSVLVFGHHAVRQRVETDPQSVLEIWVQIGQEEGKWQAVVALAEQQGWAVHWVERKTLDKLSGGGHHQGGIVRCREREGTMNLEQIFAQLSSPALLLVLDGVQDPHNLGACLRTADAMGVQAVIIPKDRACTVSPTVRKVASGAAETVPVIAVTNLVRSLEWLQRQGVWVVGADQESERAVSATSLLGPIALVLGAEGSGLRRLTREQCDERVSLRMLGRIESLNVSVAAGILLYEIVQQRMGRGVFGGTVPHSPL